MLPQLRRYRAAIAGLRGETARPAFPMPAIPAKPGLGA
jgi:hypothetical protein